MLDYQSASYARTPGHEDRSAWVVERNRPVSGPETTPGLRLAMAACVALLSLVAGCASPQGGATEENAVVHTASAAERAATRSKEPITADSALLYVNGLGCPLCATNIDMQLLRMRGVEGATIDLGSGTVLVSLAGERRPSPHDFSETVLDAGFTLVKIEPR